MDLHTDDILLELDTIKVSINPKIGGSITSLMIRNQMDQWAHVLRKMPIDTRSSSNSGSFFMLPWTNRIKDAKFNDQQGSHLLKSNCPDGSAIHGVGRDLPWSISDRSPISARLVLDSRSFDQDNINYPYQFGAIARYEIGIDRVEIELSVTNLDTHTIPVGCGHHPYFHRHLFSDADKLQIQMDLNGRYPTQGCIPTADPIDDDVCQSLRQGDHIGNPGLDDVFAGFSGNATLEWPQSNVSMKMQCSKNLNHMVIYTPRTESGDPDEYVCIEPVSMVNDGFNRLNSGVTETGVVLLEPNQTLRTQMILSFSTCV
ncbi:MAG: hypothetical protein P1U42_05060 [Phycisphaerales bacterium]|nr:hypothetical protein [Phycisphaerales bacterium]